MLVRINIPWLEDYFGEISKSKLVFLDNVSHSWEEGTHTMTLKADALPGDVDLDIWKRMTTSVQRTKSKKNDTKKASLSNASTESTSNESSTSFWEMINPFS
jgi:hypothetical protein